MKNVKILVCAFFSLTVLFPATVTQAATTKAFDYQFVSQSPSPTLNPGESIVLWVKLKNAGFRAWDRDTVRLGTSNPKDRSSAFMPDEFNAPELATVNTNWISNDRIRMEKATAWPDETVGFGFYIKVPDTQTSGVYREHFQPVVDGLEWMKDGNIYWDITVVGSGSDNISAKQDRDSTRKSDMSSLASAVELYYSDRGSYPLVYNYESLINLLFDQGYVSVLMNDPNYPIGKYGYNVSSDGLYCRFEAQLELETQLMQNDGGVRNDRYEVGNALWANASKIPTSSQQQSTTPHSYNYEIVTQSPYPSTLNPNQVISVLIDIENTGSATWYSAGSNPVRLGAGSRYGNTNQQRDYSSEFANTDWLSPNRPVTIDKSEVRPGEKARFQFNIKAPATAGTYRAYFTPVVDGIAWMADRGIYWEIRVGPSAKIASEDMAIRASSSSAIADNNDYATIIVRIEKDGDPVPYKRVNLALTHGTSKANLVKTSGIDYDYDYTDEDGMATFYVYSDQAGIYSYYGYLDEDWTASTNMIDITFYSEDQENITDYLLFEQITASSSYMGNIADNAIDLQIGTFGDAWVNNYSNSPTIENPQWLKLDFEETRSINRIVLKSFNGYSPRDLSIYFSNDGVGWTKYGEIKSNTGQTIDIDILPAVSARYLKIDISKSNHISSQPLVYIDEIEVYLPKQ